MCSLSLTSLQPQQQSSSVCPPSPQRQATAAILPVPTDVPVLDILYQRSHVLCGLLRLVSSMEHNVCQAHPCRSRWRPRNGPSHWCPMLCCFSCWLGNRCAVSPFGCCEHGTVSSCAQVLCGGDVEGRPLGVEFLCHAGKPYSPSCPLTFSRSVRSMELPIFCFQLYFLAPSPLFFFKFCKVC